ncbi:MAG: hypothetical protein IK094_07200 [Treponema sp.]|nr:hypothetical protein [Treponema sp.]
MPKNILGSRLVKIPKPRFFVFYNGKDDMPDLFKMRLSEAFISPDDSGDFEWTATVVNINEDRLGGIHKSCKSLYDYARFIAKVRECSKGGSPTAESVTEAVNWATKERLLNGFFERQKAEVIGMILTEFDMEQFKRDMREDGYDEGHQQGLQEGAQQNAIENAKKLLADGKYTAEEISGLLGIPVESFAQPAPNF